MQCDFIFFSVNGRLLNASELLFSEHGVHIHSHIGIHKSFLPSDFFFPSMQYFYSKGHLHPRRVPLTQKYENEHILIRETVYLQEENVLHKAKRERLELCKIYNFI